LLGGLSVELYNNLTHDVPSAIDFYPPWRATRALFIEGRNPYGAEVNRDIQIAVFGAPSDPNGNQFGFAYPLPVSLLIAPLAGLPYDAASAVWLGICLTLILLSVIALTAPAKPLALVAFLTFGLLFYPTARAFIAGQFAVIVWAAFTLGIVALRRGRRWDWLAGASFALSALKPQMVFLVLPVVALWALQQRRFTLLATAIGLLGVLSVAALIALPSWPLDFLATVREYGSHSPLNSPTGVILGDTPWNTLADLILIALLVLYVWREWQNGWPHLEELIFFGLIITQMIAPRTATTNQAILLIPLLTWLNRARNRQRLPAMFVLLVAPWLVYLAGLHGADEQPAACLPVPIVCLAAALFLWIRRERTVSA